MAVRADSGEFAEGDGLEFGGRGVVVLEGEAGGVVFGEEVVAEWGGVLTCSQNGGPVR